MGEGVKEMCRELQSASHDMVLGLATVVGLKEGHIRAKVGDQVGVHIDHYRAHVVARGEVPLGENKIHSAAFSLNLCFEVSRRLVVN